MDDASDLASIKQGIYYHMSAFGLYLSTALEEELLLS